MSRHGVNGIERVSCRHRNEDVLWPALAAFALPLLFYVSITVSGYVDLPFLMGDGSYYHATSVSLWEDHDLDLANQLAPPLPLHSGQVSLDRQGRLVPLHPIWMPVTALPLVALLGARGTIAFNLIVLSSLLALLFVLAQRSSGLWPAAMATCLTGILSFLPHYAYSYSQDAFLCLLLIAMLVLLPANHDQRPTQQVLAGLLVGILVTARPTFVFVLPALPLLLSRPYRRSVAWMTLGAMGPLIVWMTLNMHLFGAPLITSYDRIMKVTDAGLILHSQRGDFTLPLFEGLRGQLLNPRKGLLPTSMISLISLLGLPMLLKHARRIGLYFVVTSLGLLLVFSKYRYWHVTHVGNRFLIPVVVLSALPLASLLDWACHGIRERQRQPGRRSSLR